MKDEKFKPLKIEIERNTDISRDTPFFITINGKRLENVKRFYIDIDKDKLYETHSYGECDSMITEVKPWTYGIEFEDNPWE